MNARRNWLIKSLVATHQKTQQGLKLIVNPIYAQIVKVATHQKTQQGLKLDNKCKCSICNDCRNASENPAGIETITAPIKILISRVVATHQKTQQGLKLCESLPTLPLACCVATHQKTQQGLKRCCDCSKISGSGKSQRIRKPSRD